MDSLATNLLEHLQTAVVFVDTERAVRYLNPAAEALFEASSVRAVGEPVGNLFVDVEEPQAVICQASDGGQPITKRRAVLKLSSGETLDADYSVTPMEHGLLIEVQPIDRLLRINRDSIVNQSVAATKQLVRGLAHEIKNPLGGIRGAAQLLRRELPGERFAEYTDVIISEADRLRSLVDGLLGPNAPTALEPENLYRVIEHVLQVIRAEVGPSIPIERDYDPSLPSVRANADQLVQALLNIVRNACQALEGHDNPRILVRTRAVRNFNIGSRAHRLVVRTDIIDNGPGIPQGLIGHLFFPMISGRADGSGLGLAIAQAIASAHGGVIECESRPGETCFSLYLPLESDA